MGWQINKIRLWSEGVPTGALCPAHVLANVFRLSLFRQLNGGAFDRGYFIVGSQPYVQFDVLPVDSSNPRN